MDPVSLQNPPAIHGESVAGRAAQLRKQLMIMVEDIKERTFDLAEALYLAKSEGLYRQWGYASIGDYGDVELGLKERKTQYLVRIVEVMTACGIPRSQYEPAGVSKLREIARLDPKGTHFNGEQLEPLSDHIKSLVEGASINTTAKIAGEVNRLMGMVDGNAMVVRSFSCTQDAWDNVIKPGMEIIRKRLGDKGRDSSGQAEDYSDGKCIEMAFAEVIADPNNEDPDQAVVLESEPDIENTLGDIPMESDI